MTKVLNTFIKAGRRDLHGPRPIGDLLAEMLHSDSPLAKGFRRHLASDENDAEKGGEV